MRTNYSIKNSITAFISNIVSFLFIFISQTVFIKTLGIEYNGLNGLFSNILTFLNLFELGIGNAIIFNLYKSIAKNNKEEIKSLLKYYKNAYNIIALLILIVGLLIIPLIPLIAKTEANINIYIVYILFLLSTVSSYFLTYRRNLIYASQRSYILNIIHVGYIIILNILQLLVIYFTKNYYLYLIIKIICILIENIVIYFKAGKDYPYLYEKNIKKLNNNTKKDITSRVKAIFIHKFSNSVTYGTDNILISIFFGLKTVGIYANYQYIIASIDRLFRGIVEATTASVGNLLLEKNYEKRFTVFKRINLLNFWIAVTTSVSLMVLLNPFINLWLGKDFLLSTIIVAVLVFDYFQSLMRSSFYIFKNAAGIWVEDKYVPIIKVLINLISSIIFIKLFGLIGVFLGTIFSTVTIWFYSYPKFVYKKLFDRNYKYYYIDMIKTLIVFIIILTSSYYLSNLIILDNLMINLILKFIISIIVSNILLLIIFYKNDSYKYYRELIKNKIKR